LNAYFGMVIGSHPPTKSAFCQARLKLKDSFHESFFNKTVSLFDTHACLQTFKGFRLLACDTTVQKLPDNEQTRLIGVHKNQHLIVASTKILTYHDVLNSLTTYAALHDKALADIRCAQAVVSSLAADSISIYDRGFGSHLIPYLHTHYGSKYVVRLRLEFSNTTKAFMQSKVREVTISEQIQPKALKELHKLGIHVSSYDTLTYRLVKIELSTGETEILMTNLDDSFTAEDLAEIYRLRWGIETAYNYFKNTFMLGTFSGYSPTAVKQDIWCVLIMYNLQTILQYDCQKELEAINKKRKADYKINRNVGAGSLRNLLKDLFLVAKNKLQQTIKHIQNLYMASLEKVKPNKEEREPKRLRSNDRLQTELNYKRGF
jgi:Transposase DDE domain